MEKVVLLTTIHLVLCNWETEWLIPIQDTYSKETARKTPDEVVYKIFDDKAASNYEDRGQEVTLKNKDMEYGIINDESKSVTLTEKLKDTILNAKALADTLKTQIVAIASREKNLKEAIVSGRSGTTVLNVLSTSRIPRTYIIRDGFWTICNGMVQYPAKEQRSRNNLNELFAEPRCIGQEVSSRHDPCVFNSIIKYETIPRRRGLFYSEDDYLCLKTSFNHTLEQYLSVPKYIVNETCRNGIVKRLADNFLDCGLRVMSEYTYFPYKGFAANNLPLEYCTEKGGACKLTIAWHISNGTVENFEYVKSDKAFKNFFMNPVAHGSTVI